MAHIPLIYKEHYESLKKWYPSMRIDFTRNYCCKVYSELRYSIPDWYDGGHYFRNKCKVCGKEWWQDELEIFGIWDDDEGDFVRYPPPPKGEVRGRSLA